MLSCDASLKDAIECLNLSGMQIAMITNEEEKLVGTLTDGDIRRGLISGLNLSDPITGIVNWEPLVAPISWKGDMVLEVMRSNTIKQIPIIDDDGRVSGLHCLDDFLARPVRSNLMIIMAGGRGERMLQHTDKTPKPLLPIGGKPMLEHIIMRAASEGFRNFVITTNYLGSMIEKYFALGEKWNVKIDYIRETHALGTAGALSLLNPAPVEPVLVTNGDVLTDIKYGDLLDFHIANDSVATMAVKPHEVHNPFGVVKIDGDQIMGFEEKPVWRNIINAGIYALNPDSLKYLTISEHCDMPDLFTRIGLDNKLCLAYPMHERWIDVGRPDDLPIASDFLLSNK